MTALIEIRGVSKRYPAGPALDGVDLCMAAGEVWGLLGENGAGKSTLLKILAGLQHPSGGQILLRGVPVDPASVPFRASTGYASERPALYGCWSVRRNLAFFAALRGLPEATALASAQRLGLGALLDRPLGDLSRGQVQRAALAVATVGDPTVVLLDEPHGGLDVALLEVLAGVVRDLASRGGAVLMTSHVLSAVTTSCSHIAILRQGRIVAAGRISELTAGSSLLSLADLYRNTVRAA